MEKDVSKEGRSPRYWLAAKFGNKTELINRMSLIEDYVVFLRDTLYSKGVDLYERPFMDIMLADEDLIRITRAIKQMLECVHNGRRPILFIIDDYHQGRNALKKFLQDQFDEQVFLFNTTGNELNSMRLKGSFEEAKDWCQQFITMCFLKYDRVLDFEPVEEKTEGEDDSPITFDDVSTTLSLADEDFPDYLNELKDDNDEPIGDLFPVKPRLDGVTPTSSDSPPGQKRDSPPDEAYVPKTMRRSVPGQHMTLTPPMVLDPPISAQLVADAVGVAHICPDFATIVVGEKLFRRFQIPFESVLDNYHLLELVYHTMVPTPTTVEHKKSTLKILTAFTDSRYVEYVCVLIRSHNNDAECLLLLEALMHIFLATLDFMDIDERFMFKHAWETFHALVDICPYHVWNSKKGSREWFMDGINVILGIKVKSAPPPKPPLPPPEEKQMGPFIPQKPKEEPFVFNQQQEPHNHTAFEDLERKHTAPVCNEPTPTRFELKSTDKSVLSAVSYNGAQPSVSNVEQTNVVALWMQCEGKEPPCDFRELPEYPVRDDVVDPTPSFLRRSIVNAAYKNSQHYLDVQYRLFREDLISPIRDGLHLHKMFGTSRYSRGATEDCEVVASDLIIFEVDWLGGVQARTNTGENIRYIKLKPSPFLTTVAPRHLKFGQVVILSSDGFAKDVHLAVIAERSDYELLTNACLGLSFYEEDGLEVGKNYIMAEPSNYLEMYTHVLKVFKETTKYSPLPLERYLVHAKSNTRLPYYLRNPDKETEAEREENREMMKYYDGLTKKRLVLPTQTTSTREYTDSGEDDYDFEFDIAGLISKSKTKRFHYLADESTLEYMMVKGSLYKVSEMAETFKPVDLDESQRKAMIAALTSEMALIQGPPGTGKTFIGVEIVSTLLENQFRRGQSAPILLVCYTNAALDQFLEKIIDRVESDRTSRLYQHQGPVAVRLGTKSESNKLERARVLRKDVVSDYKDLAQDEDKKSQRAYNQKRKSQLVLATACYVISQEAQRHIMSYEAVCQMMPHGFRNEFLGWMKGRKDTRGNQLEMDEVLACWLLDMSLEGGADDRFTLPPEGDSDSEECLTKPRHQRCLDEGEETAESLDEVFRLLNLEAQAEKEARAALAKENYDDLYETERQWDILKGNGQIPDKVKIFGDGMKEISLNAQVSFDPTITTALFDVKDAILRTKPLTAQEEQQIRSAYGIPKQRRWELFAFWVQKLRSGIRTSLPGEMSRFKSDCDKQMEARKNLDAAVMRKSLIVGATTTGAAKARELLEELGCTTLIIEEAAEVLEAHTFASFLPSIEHAILIGDHQQLRPNPAVFELARSYNMDVSLFERLINNGTPYSTLAKQHRMCIDITANLVRPHFYPILEDAANVGEYPNVKGMAKNMFFWSHDSPEQTGMDGVSYNNPGEVEMIMTLLDYILKQGVYGTKEITVIATYSAQVDKLRQAVRLNFGTAADSTDPAVSVETVDSFQGKENKIIIVSLVRSAGPTIGFLSVPNRICVALTRAQHGMYVVGNMHHFSYSSHLWNEIVGSLDRAHCVSEALPIKCASHNTLQHISVPGEFLTKAPNGGCSKDCLMDLPCQHTCPRKCHPNDDHSYWQCMLDCMRTCNNKKYNHPCPKKCYEQCDTLCSVPVAVTLNCGHQVNVACHRSASPKCESRCDKLLPCKHRCRELCGVQCTTACKEEVVVTFGCGHEITVPCNKSRANLSCEARCAEILPCGHVCAEQCGDLCTFECMENVNHKLHCGHDQDVPCSKNPLRHPCQFPMKQTLSCGHTVNIACFAGTDRSKCSAICRSLLPCGHACGKQCGECYVDGVHKCFDTCNKLQPCGHVCTKRCGEPCGDCGANCLSGCSHMTCGSPRTIGVMAFQRTCREQCVMCAESCENSCEHRACSLRCFEVCNVKPCEKGCKHQLPCRHACLGLCGEACPEMCGTCYRKQYEDLVNHFLPGTTSFVRLIKIKGCQHIFPVSYLDDHVMQSKNRNEWPRCPTCNQPIHSNRRYLRIIKKIIYDAYIAKELVRNAQLKMDSAKLLRNFFEAWQSVHRRKENVQDRKRIAVMYDSLNEVYSQMTLSVAKQEKDVGAFWNDVLNISRCMISIFEEFLDSVGIPRFIRDLPHLEQLVDHHVPRGQVNQSVVDSLNECGKFFLANLDTRMSGAIIPKMRQILARALFYFMIGKLWLTLKKKNADLSRDQTKDLQTLARLITSSTLDTDTFQAYMRLHVYINKKVLDPLGLPGFPEPPPFPSF